MKIKTDGGGLSVHIPVAILEKVPLKKGDVVCLRPQGRCIVIEKMHMDEVARLRAERSGGGA